MKVTQRELPRQQRGRERRAAIIEATVEIMTEQGMSAVSHRTVAAQANVPLASTTYYFTDLDELLEAAGQVLTARWIAHARLVASRLQQQVTTRSVESTLRDTPQTLTAARQAAILVTAILPQGDENVIRSHYARLIEAGRRPAVARAFAEARPELEMAINEVLKGLDLIEVAANDSRPGRALSAELILALVDGAAISALSEGRDVREMATRLVEQVFSRCCDVPRRG